jgi:hypothetical protein
MLYFVGGRKEDGSNVRRRKLAEGKSKRAKVKRGKNF